MAQRFIPEIADGDKRVLLIAGEPVPFCAGAHPEAGRDARQSRRRRPRRRAAAHRARSRDRRGARADAVGRGPARRRARRHRRLPDRGQRDEPDVLRRDRAADRLRRRRHVRRRAGEAARVGLSRPRLPRPGAVQRPHARGRADPQESRRCGRYPRCGPRLRAMIGILIIAHDTLGESLARAVTHVLGGRPPQFEVLLGRRDDDPLELLPPRKAASRSSIPATASSSSRTSTARRRAISSAS